MRRLFVALLVTAIAFVACAGPVATSPSPTASAQATPKPPKDKVTLTGINSTELRDQVKAVKGLKGKKIGFTTPGSGTWALGNVYLKKAGLDPDKDVELVSLGGDNAVFYTALQSGRVDAIVSFEPIAERVIADNVGVFLLDPYQPGQAKEWTGSDKAAALFL